jgi:hypothetical protein
MKLLATGWKTGLRFQAEERFTSTTTVSRPALGATQPHIKWVPVSLYPEGKAADTVSFEPRLRVRGDMPHFSHTSSWPYALLSTGYVFRVQRQLYLYSTRAWVSKHISNKSIEIQRENVKCTSNKFSFLVIFFLEYTFSRNLGVDRKIILE